MIAAELPSGSATTANRDPQNVSYGVCWLA
jgi:hypothetical protein